MRTELGDLNPPWSPRATDRRSRLDRRYGNTAHVFDEFAPKLKADCHVYGMTQRGFGASGFSASENGVDRLRDDALAVLDALKLNQPVLVGHSIAGAELSSVATSHPDRVE